MDHLFLVHGIAKDTNHHGSTILSKEAKVAREQCKKHALDAGMSEARFQGICKNSVWKIIKTETQRNIVAEMYLCMTQKCTNNWAGWRYLRSTE